MKLSHCLPQFTLQGLLAWTTALAVAMRYLRIEWKLGLAASPLLGPLWFAWYGDRGGWVWAAILLPSVFAPLLKFHVVTALISAAALVLWILLGVAGTGIGC
jgi:hypothetical protein